MSQQPVTICVDAFGGDDAPEVVLSGAALALERDEGLSLLLTGDGETVMSFSAAHERVTGVPTTEVIGMGEHPASAVRRKKDSSIVVGCRLVKEGRAEGFFSAGSTGACMSAATLVMGRIPGVKRPTLTTVIPGVSQQVLLSDCGANADCKPEYLVQFAQMNTIFARTILGHENPKVALLNIGAEETKGSSAAQEAYTLLKAAVPEFVGNCEGSDILSGEYDVIITDGFTGNVALKSTEGALKTLFGMLKGAMMSSTKAKLGAALLKSDIRTIAHTMNAESVGGSPLLGVRGACYIGHGASTDTAICNGILATASACRLDLVKRIEDVIGNS